MLLAAARRSPVEVALGGFIAFEALHVVSHVIDRDLGGRPAFDIPALTLLAIAGVAALISGRRSEARQKRRGQSQAHLLQQSLYR